MAYFIKNQISENKIGVCYDDQLSLLFCYAKKLIYCNAVNLAFLSNVAYTLEENQEESLIDETFFSKILESYRTLIFFNDARNFASPFISTGIDKDLRIIHENCSPLGISFRNISETGTQFFYYQTQKEIVISIRGTQISKLKDILADLRIHNCRFRESPVGEVHDGFYSCFLSIKPEIDKLLQGHLQSKHVIITGHSLGGAIATLLAAYIRERYTDKVMLYTFGCPRVGDTDFCAYFTKTKSFTYYRFVNSNDIVSMIPLPKNNFNWKLVPLALASPLCLPAVFMDFDGKPYQHLGTLVFIGWNKAGIPEVIDTSSIQQFEKKVESKNAPAKKGKSPEELRSLLDASVADHNMETYLSILTAKLHQSIKTFFRSRQQNSSDTSKNQKQSSEEIYSKIIDTPFDEGIESEFRYQIGSSTRSF